MVYVSVADNGATSSNGFYARIAAFFSAIVAANVRVGYGEPFGL